MVKTLAFGCVGLWLVYLFRKDINFLGNSRFYLFMALESLLLLLFFNLDYAIRKPSSVMHIFSWIFLLLSGLYLVNGLYTLKKIKPFLEKLKSRAHLLTQGLYRYVRHPIFAGLIFLALGIMLVRPWWLTIIVFFASVVSTIMAAFREEIENRQTFGRVYDSYQKSTKRFVPYVI